MTLEARLVRELDGTPLAAYVQLAAEPLIERRAKDACVGQLRGRALTGLARVVAANAEAARFLSMRPTLFAELCGFDDDPLPARARALQSRPCPDHEHNLEDFLDALRLLRRDEMLVAACCQFGGISPYSRVSEYLSIVAETCVRWALEAAQRDRPDSRLSVLGMGKIAGHEFSYHSDLDVIFLYPDEVEDVMQPSRTAQKLITYLTTMTGAGYAYAVDSRLRPSGGQGSLVTTHSAYTSYQTSRAATWEHLALMRGRAIAGEVDAAQAVLDRTRAAVLQQSRDVWPALADMRKRVEAERAGDEADRVYLKTGPGGLMDVEFLAGGCLLECQRQVGGTALPSIAAMFQVARDTLGVPVDGLIERYGFLRHVEACARFVAGRPPESLDLNDERTATVAELVEPGLSLDRLAEQIREAREANRQVFKRVISAGSIAGAANS